MEIGTKQTLAHNTITKIAFDVEDYDSLDTADPSNNEITAPADGTYDINATVGIDRTTFNGAIAVQSVLFINGSEELRQGTIVYGDGDLHTSVIYSDHVELNANDTVDIRLEQRTGSDVGTLTTASGELGALSVVRLG
jgi:hypothetical protein